MTPKQLLQQCEVLTHQARMRRMVELGRLAASDANVGNTISILAQGDVYQRVLATQSCYGSQNAAQALRTLSDPTRSVRALALHLVALICSDAELQDALALLPLDLQEVLLRHLQRRRRQAPIDTHLEMLASRHDAALKKLLPFGSRMVVTRHLGQVIEQLDLVTWRRLARRYPELVVEHLRSRATATETLDPQFIIQVNAILLPLTRCAPDLALDLVRTLVMTFPLAHLDLHALLQQRPDEIAELVLQANEESRLTFNGVAHRLDTGHLLALFTRYPAAINTQCFEKLTPQQRLVAYTACERGWRSEEGVLPYHVVAALPTTQRLHEGRRHLALPALTARPLERLRSAAFLPWEEAHATLDVPLRSPNADVRSAALQALIAATRYLREHLADVLQLLRNRRNEQDPVRRGMLTALADLPHGMWRAEHLEDLAQIFRQRPPRQWNVSLSISSRSIQSGVLNGWPFSIVSADTSVSINSTGISLMQISSALHLRSLLF